MTNETVKHKVNVFISSRCGGKYEIARKALEKLLNETGLVQCYCFETEPGCSMSMPSAYLDQIPLHQLLLLITKMILVMQLWRNIKQQKNLVYI